MALLHSLRMLGVLCLSRRALKDYRDRFDLRGLVETHHVVPRCCARHPAIRAHGFDVEGPGNFALLPSAKGRQRLRLRPERVVHTGSHMRYNAYVWRRLDATVHSEAAFVATVAELHHRVRHDPDVPWN